MTGKGCTADFIGKGKPMLLGMAKTMITDFIGTGSRKSYHIKGKCALAFVRWRIVRLFYIITIIIDRQQLCPACPAAKLSFTLRPAALACLFYNAYYVIIPTILNLLKQRNGRRVKYVGAKSILSRLP